MLLRREVERAGREQRAGSGRRAPGRPSRSAPTPGRSPRRRRAPRRPGAPRRSGRRSVRSTLLTAITTGTGAASQQAGDEPVARPDPLLGVDHEQAAVGVGELALDPSLHPLGERVARALDAGQIDEHELPVGAGGDAADRAARRLRLVGDDRDLRADDRVGERRLADVGPAGERDEARSGRRMVLRLTAGSPHPAHQLGLEREHLAVVGLVVHPAEVQRAVDDGLAQVLGLAGADDDVAELPRPGRARRPRRPRTTARRSAQSISRCSRLSSRIRSSSTNSIATWPSPMPAEESASAHSSSSSTPWAPRVAARLPGATASIPITSISSTRSSRPIAYARLRGRSSGAEPLRVLGVGGDDPPDELVADDVLLAEADELDPLDLARGSPRRPRGPSRARAAGRSA